LKSTDYAPFWEFWSGIWEKSVPVMIRVSSADLL